MPEEIQDQRIAEAVGALRDQGRDDIADLLLEHYHGGEAARADLEAAGLVAGELRAQAAELAERAEAGDKTGGIASQLAKNGTRLALELSRLLVHDDGAGQYPTVTWLVRTLTPEPAATE